MIKMSDVLSQEEIDALVNKMKDGDEDEEDDD